MTLVDCGEFSSDMQRCEGGTVVFLNEQRPLEYVDFCDSHGYIGDDCLPLDVVDVPDDDHRLEWASPEAINSKLKEHQEELLKLQPAPYDEEKMLMASYNEPSLQGAATVTVTATVAANDSNEAEEEFEFNEPETRVTGSWQSSGQGDWCAWYTTQLHAVLPVTAGVRVVAVFNILLDESVTSECDESSPLPAVASESQQQRTPFEKAVWESNLFEEVFRAETPRGLSPLKLGFVLHHQYSCDGYEEVPLQNLRGRDAHLVDTMTAYLNKSLQCHQEAVSTQGEGTASFQGKKFVLRLQPVDVVIEAPQENKPSEHPRHWWAWHIHIVRDANAWYLLTAQEKRRSDRSVEQGGSEFHIQYELDVEYPVASGSRLCDEHRIYWGSTTNYISTFVNTHVAENKFKDLWGNHAMFSIYWYKSCVAMWELV